MPTTHVYCKGGSRTYKYGGEAGQKFYAAFGSHLASYASHMHHLAS